MAFKFKNGYVCYSLCDLLDVPFYDRARKFHTHTYYSFDYALQSSTVNKFGTVPYVEKNIEA